MAASLSFVISFNCCGLKCDFLERVRVPEEFPFFSSVTGWSVGEKGNDTGAAGNCDPATVGMSAWQGERSINKAAETTRHEEDHPAPQIMIPPPQKKKTK